MGEINYWNNDKKNPSSDGLIIFHLLHFLEVDYRFHTGQYDIKMTDPNWRYGTEVTNGTSNVSAGRCPKHNLPLDDIPTPPPTLTKGNFTTVVVWNLGKSAVFGYCLPAKINVFDFFFQIELHQMVLNTNSNKTDILSQCRTGTENVYIRQASTKKKITN